MDVLICPPPSPPTAPVCLLIQEFIGFEYQINSSQLFAISASYTIVRYQVSSCWRLWRYYQQGFSIPIQFLEKINLICCPDKLRLPISNNWTSTLNISTFVNEVKLPWSSSIIIISPIFEKSIKFWFPIGLVLDSLTKRNYRGCHFVTDRIIISLGFDYSFWFFCEKKIRNWIIRKVDREFADNVFMFFIDARHCWEIKERENSGTDTDR